mmetsp:Transcript_40943/g.128917  ORF Transcript_40943/g.128917 Transcript_40943/m.128917 type:complete len:91 (-) Transcript_40943:429-701(-)
MDKLYDIAVDGQQKLPVQTVEAILAGSQDTVDVWNRQRAVEVCSGVCNCSNHLHYSCQLVGVQRQSAALAADFVEKVHQVIRGRLLFASQ